MNNLFELFNKSLGKLSDLIRFTLRVLKVTFSAPFEVKEIVNQCYLIGCKSFPLVAITSLIMGLVLTIQSRPTLAIFGAESWLPAMISISMIREIGPVIISLICAGKVGSGMGAEIASMKVTEQIDSMEVSGINPFKYLVVTRVLAATLMIPLLVILGDAVSLWGAYLGVNLTGDVSSRLFIGQVFERLKFSDFFPAVIKTFFFGGAIGIIGCFEGYHSDHGTQGVGKAANSAVVFSSLAIFLIDGVVVQITSGLGR